LLARSAVAAGIRSHAATIKQTAPAQVRQRTNFVASWRYRPIDVRFVCSIGCRDF